MQFFIIIMVQAYEGHAVECGGLNKNGSHRLIYLHAKSPGNRTV